MTEFPMRDWANDAVFHNYERQIQKLDNKKITRIRSRNTYSWRNLYTSRNYLITYRYTLRYSFDKGTIECFFHLWKWLYGKLHSIINTQNKEYLINHQFRKGGGISETILYLKTSVAFEWWMFLDNGYPRILHIITHQDLHIYVY